MKKKKKKSSVIRCPKCDSKDITISSSKKYGNSNSKKKCKGCKNEW